MGRRRRSSSSSSCPAMDLFIALPQTDSNSSSAVDRNSSTILLHDMIRYCKDAGYRTVAVTKTVYGRPSSETDRASSIPEVKKITQPMTILKRLHVVLENASDVAYFCNTTSSSSVDNAVVVQPTSIQQEIFQEYDLVSVSPRNEAVWKAICNSAITYADIVTLEACDSGNENGYTIRPTDVAAIMNRNMVFEIPYAASVVNQTKYARKQFIQTFRSLLNASIGKHPHILVSSGNRSSGRQTTTTRDDGFNNDCGSLALRNPEDIINLLRTVILVQHGNRAQNDARNTLTQAAQFALTRSRQRRYGKLTRNIIIHNVRLLDSEEEAVNVKKARIEAETIVPSDAKVKTEKETTAKVTAHEDQDHTNDDDEDDANDGFIAF